MWTILFLSLDWNSGTGKYHQTSPQKRWRENWQRHAWRSTEIRFTAERWLHRWELFPNSYVLHSSLYTVKWKIEKGDPLLNTEQDVHSWKRRGCRIGNTTHSCRRILKIYQSALFFYYNAITLVLLRKDDIFGQLQVAFCGKKQTMFTPTHLNVWPCDLWGN